MKHITLTEPATSWNFLNRLESMGVDHKFKLLLMNPKHSYHNLMANLGFILIVDNRGPVQKKVLIAPVQHHAKHIMSIIADQDYLSLEESY